MITIILGDQKPVITVALVVVFGTPQISSSILDLLASIDRRRVPVIVVHFEPLSGMFFLGAPSCSQTLQTAIVVLIGKIKCGAKCMGIMVCK